MNKDSKRTCGKQKRMKWDRYSRQGKRAKGSEEKNEKKVKSKSSNKYLID